VADLDIIELNEAFSAQALAVMKATGISFANTNIDGGALALGHPLGATGPRTPGMAAALLTREGTRVALATQCDVPGQGIATARQAC